METIIHLETKKIIILKKFMRKLQYDEIAQKRLSPEQLQKETRFPVYILLDNVRSLYNVGSIFRSADGARVTKLYLCGYTPHPPRKEIEKTALGATATVPWEYVKDPHLVISQLKQRGIHICLLEQTDQSEQYFSIQKNRFPLCLVVGNELSGISKEIIAQADSAVEIPMFGMKHSLNVAVALGIVLFEFINILNSQK
ncbi:MAG TPA: RNA methyltransferase [Bacteroidota bacterium]|nr:RNA methyltransferase [Bacteroidota bacterium]